MLRLSGLDNFCNLPLLHDMRYKGPRLSEIIRNTYHRDPLNGDVYIYFSRDRRTILEQIQQESETSAEYDPSQGMTEQELHNFCRFLYSQLQAKDEEIKHLSSNVMELTQEVRLSRLQQQSINDEHMAANASASEKLDSILAELTATKHQLLKTQRELADTNVLLASERAEKQKLKEEKQKYEKERSDLLEEISSLRSDLYSGTKSQQTNRSGSHVNVNDGEDDFDGTEES